MSELIKQFGIDWRLLVAQAVNFGILFFVLWRFAYRPMLQVFSERRKKIQEGMLMREEAERKLLEAGREKEALLKKTEEESLALISRAEAIGKERGEKIFQEAIKKGEGVVLSGKKAVEEEKAKMNEAIYKDAESLIVMGVAKVLGKMPQEERDKDLVREALQELKALR